MLDTLPVLSALNPNAHMLVGPHTVLASPTLQTLDPASALTTADNLFPTDAVAVHSAALSSLAGIASQVTILLLLACCAIVALVGFLHRDHRSLRTLIAAALGTVLASGLATVIKDIVREPRPCQSAQLGRACPPAGDWSFPSNHTTIAFALALALALILVSRKWIVPAPVIVSGTGIARVLTSEHYVHDVLAGAGIGLLVVLIVTLLLRGPAAWLTSRAVGHRRNPSRPATIGA